MQGKNECKILSDSNLCVLLYYLVVAIHSYLSLFSERDVFEKKV